MMCTYEVTRQRDICPIGPAISPKQGDIMVLKSRKGSKKYIVMASGGRASHCGVTCALSRSNCIHYKFNCKYYHYLKPVTDVMEEL